MTYTLHLGDCIEAMRAMPDNSVDSIVTDPPYGLSFMGKKWDYDVPSVEIWVECLRVLKPGGHLLAFAGTRTQHRMAVRIEDAGFEIRDMIAWVYGSGFPKSRNLSGDWQGWGTALKPALEPITVARKPLTGTVAANVLAHGTGALNIDGCRVGWPDGKAPEIGTPGWGGPAKKLTAVPGQDGDTVERSKPSDLGRWPANLIHDGSDDVVVLFPSEACASAPVKSAEPTANGFSGPVKYSGMRERVAGAFHADTGSAARFFYCAKTTRKDRNEGCELLPERPSLKIDPTSAMARDGNRGSGVAANHHPTVKPTDLMAYLLRLVTPIGGVALDPFMGSGSTGKAAIREGFQFIGCELDPEYLAIAKARIEHEQTKVAAARESAVATESQLSLFGS